MFIRNRNNASLFSTKKTGDCGSPPTPNKPKADSERLVAAREHEDRRRRGFKVAWRDEFAWLTYEPAPTDSDSNGAPAGAPVATGSASSDGTTTKPPTLDERKGLFLGETYRNEKACKYFIHSIANMEKDKVTAEMKDVKFITVVSDGSTDVSVSENEIV